MKSIDGEAGRDERADSINAAVWAILAGSCYYLGKFIPSGECVKEIGPAISNCLPRGESTWRTKVGSAGWSIIRGIPASSQPIAVVDEVEYSDGDHDDYDDDDDDTHPDDEVIHYE